MNRISYTLDKSKVISISERKLKCEVTIGFANKIPKFIAVDKHTIVLQK